MPWNGGFFTSLTPPIRSQADTGSELAREWANPSVVVATVLMFVGGNVVQEALAQTTGEVFTPVCFSFGWVSYALSSLKDVFGEGRLLPQPDYPVKVFNVMSGYYRVNKNWLIGRIVRDHESWISKFEPLSHSGIRIAIFEAMPVTQRKPVPFRFNTRYFLGVMVMVVQLVVAAIPTIRTQGHEWGILAITGFGTLLVVIMGSLPQWWVEKVPNKLDSNKVFALTSGNGSRDVIIIKGEGRCLDLEDLAILDSPRTGKPWTKSGKFSLPSCNSWGREAKMMFGHPVGFQITRMVCIFQTLGWFLILISLAGIRSHTWCLFAVGAMGLIHNSILANLKREPKTRNLPLKLLDTISTNKIMDGLMDLEETHERCGKALLQEFFPGKLRADEEEWWEIDKEKRSSTKYDIKRLKECARRLRPRSMLPKYNLHATICSPTSPMAPNFPLEREAGQAMSTSVTQTYEEVPKKAPTLTLRSVPSSPEASHYQSNLGFIDDQLYRARSLEPIIQPTITRTESRAMSTARSLDLAVETDGIDGTMTSEVVGNLRVARPVSTVDDTSTLTMPKRPYWD
jgi:hypothetical protein